MIKIILKKININNRVKFFTLASFFLTFFVLYLSFFLPAVVHAAGNGTDPSYPRDFWPLVLGLFFIVLLEIFHFRKVDPEQKFGELPGFKEPEESSPILNQAYELTLFKTPIKHWEYPMQENHWLLEGLTYYWPWLQQSLALFGGGILVFLGYKGLKGSFWKNKNTNIPSIPREKAKKAVPIDWWKEQLVLKKPAGWDTNYNDTINPKTKVIGVATGLTSLALLGAGRILATTWDPIAIRTLEDSYKEDVVLKRYDLIGPQGPSTLTITLNFASRIDRKTPTNELVSKPTEQEIFIHEMEKFNIERINLLKAQEKMIILQQNFQKCLEKHSLELTIEANGKILVFEPKNFLLNSLFRQELQEKPQEFKKYVRFIYDPSELDLLTKIISEKEEQAIILLENFKEQNIQLVYRLDFFDELNRLDSWILSLIPVLKERIHNEVVLPYPKQSKAFPFNTQIYFLSFYEIIQRHYTEEYFTKLKSR